MKSPKWNEAFADEINGYPSGAILESVNTPELYWISLVDNNKSNPDTGGANWEPYKC